MATIVDTYTREDGHIINVYESGAEYDVTQGKLVGGPPQTRFTPETAAAARDRWAEAKREAIVRGAARALEKSGDWTAPTGFDVAEAIAEAVTIKALNPDNAKQVDAARFVLQEAGMAERQPLTTADSQQSAAAAFGTEIARQMAAILADVLNHQQQIHATDNGVIDGSTAD